MGITLIPLVARYWWAVAIAALIVALKIQDSRLRTAVAAASALKTEIATMNQQNHALKSASDECNARVDQMRSDGESLKARLDEATRRSDAIAAAGIQAAADTMAHLPANDCESILRYGHQEAAQFKW